MSRYIRNILYLEKAKMAYSLEWREYKAPSSATIGSLSKPNDHMAYRASLTRLKPGAKGNVSLTPLLSAIFKRACSVNTKSPTPSRKSPEESLKKKEGGHILPTFEFF